MTPKDWGQGSLGEYLEDARHNTVATFANCRPQYEVHAAIDQLYCTMLDNLTQSPDFFAGFFLLRTHSSFRVGVSLSLAGQVPEAYMALRGCQSHLQGIDARTHDIAKSLYEQTIDLGGHPNERTVTTQIAIETTGQRHTFTADYFLCGGVQQALALKTVARVGVCCLDVFAHVFRLRYQLLGIDLRLDQLRKGL
jgi:hypothetical protein